VEAELAKHALEMPERGAHARWAQALGRQAAVAKSLAAAADLDR
jgi:hypothetical protein